MFQNHISRQKENLKEISTSFKPLFYRLKNEDDKIAIQNLLKENERIIIHDEIECQIKELIKLKNPKIKLQEKDYEKLTEKLLEGLDPDFYGVWVYYPWNYRLVHILDEEEFIEVRTNRNQYKITPEESEFLSKQKIGVIGLSVGQSISLTLALERTFGELRIADFDVLELSNLNRIRSGIANLNSKKTICVAREIAEIDPFLNVKIYSEGITENNIDSFLTEGGNLNILIDECDGLDVKVLCRHKAKVLKIPVFMESSDRGTIDVERFDLEPNRPILHGLIDHLDHSKLKYLKTNEEKIPYILPMLGSETISKRMKASMLEIEQTITTWPQLASSVVFGGGIGADICRRIMLGTFNESGRYIVDMEELVGNKLVDKTIDSKNGREKITALSTNEMAEIFKIVEANFDLARIHLEDNKLQELINYAAMAPSVGNNQPWKWYYKEGILLLFYDLSITDSYGDFNQIGTHVAMGACIENLTLKTNQLGLTIKEELFSIEKFPSLVAGFTFKNEISSGLNPLLNLANFIDKRCTNRSIGIKKEIPESELNELIEIAKTIPGAELQIITADKQIETITEIAACCDRLRFMHPQGHYDFFNKEIRWNDAECQKNRDGLDINSFDLTATEKTGFQIASDPLAINYLSIWNKGSVFEKMTRKAMSTSSAIAYLTMPTFDKISYINGGKAVQRILLEATKRKLDTHPFLAPLFLFTRLNKDIEMNMSNNMASELIELQNKFYSIFSKPNKNTGEIFLFKISPQSELRVKSLRKSVDSILTIEN